MCDRGDSVRVRVRIPADLSCSGRAHWKRAQIDRCIASLVRALQSEVETRGSCCGHGQTLGSIDLEDGRILLVLGRPHALRFLAKAGDDAAQAEVLLAALRGESAPGLPDGLDGG